MADFNGLFLDLRPAPASTLKNVILEDDAELSKSTYKMDWCFQVREACLITHLGVRVANYRDRGDMINPTYRISLQGVATTGAPDGSIKNGGACFAAVTFTEEMENTFQWISIEGSPYGASRGEVLAMVLEYSSGTIDSFHFTAISRILLNSSYIAGGFPYSGLTRTSRNITGDRPVWGYKSSSKVYGNPISNLDRATAGGARQVALRFVFDSEWAEFFTVQGVRWIGIPAKGGSSGYDVSLYSGKTLLQRISVDGDLRGYTGSSLTDRVSEVWFDEDTLSQLEHGKEYFLALSSDDAGDAMEVLRVQTMSSDDLDALPGGNAFSYAERENTSDDWTVVDSYRPCIAPIIDEWSLAPSPAVGLHVKFFPRYNDNFFVEHADDQIDDGSKMPEGEPHEVERFPIGDSIKPYGGFATLEVFLNPDTDFGADTLIFSEDAIEKFKIIPSSNFVEGDFAHYVFRFRSVAGSDHYVDVSQYVRVVA